MTDPAWVEHVIWWQVYPLGFVGAYPADTRPTADEHRLRRIVEWFDHAIELGASGLALGPIFASRTHGYDTTDHYRVDPRLGDDADFDHLVAEARGRGLRVLLDGVFNHVGTDFANTSWFRKRSNTSGFDTFEGHGDLIALDHDNPEVIDYTVDVMTHWLARGADGWRLDAAYAVAGPVLGAGAAPRSLGVSGYLVRRGSHSRGLFGAGARQRLRLGDAVRIVEGDLERHQ